MSLLDKMDRKATNPQSGSVPQQEALEAAQLRDRVHHQVVDALNKRDEKHGGGASGRNSRPSGR